MGKQWQAKNNANARDRGDGRRVDMGRDRLKGHTVGQGVGGKINGAGEGKKEIGLENDTGQENNKPNGNK